MQKWILAVSADNDFLEQISAHLQEGGRFLVICARSGKEALTAAGSQPFDLAILDSEISDLPFVPLTRELTALIPNLRMLVYPPNNNPKHPALNGLIANGFLNKPFFGPEVISKITGVFKEIPPEQLADQQIEKTLPELWLEDPNIGAQQIEQLVGATSATAGLLLLRGQVIAATGALSNESAGNIINFLTRYWTNIQSGELFRYLRMNYETVTYLVYAVPLFKNVAVGLVYHPGASLEEVRSEVTELRKGFLNRYTNTGELRHDFGIKETVLGSNRISTGALRPPQRAKTRPIPPEPQAENHGTLENEEPLELSENELNKLDALIADMPSPDPEPIRPATKPLVEPQPEMETPPPVELTQVEPPAIPVPPLPVVDATENKTAFSDEASEKKLFEEATQAPVTEEIPQMEEKDTAPLQPIEPANEVFPNFDFKLPWEAEEKNPPVPQTEEAIPIPPPLPTSVEAAESPASEGTPSQSLPPDLPQTEPLPTWFDDFVSLESQPQEIRPEELLFRYNFLLLPRSDEQFITRNFAEILNQVLPKVHLANQWEFLSLSIRPQYLLWSAAFPLSVPVPAVANEVKKACNEKLFTQFPQLLSELPGADFWAKGYFAISGANSPSARLIHDYMELSRESAHRLTDF